MWLYDISRERIEAGIATITGNMSRQITSGRITEVQRDAALDHIHPAEELLISRMSTSQLNPPQRTKT